ncbi:solute carrier family 2, facilitated glucose transporter member 1-like isoform X2 [Aricia agestis]|uniref:solute carrier family 2, facilitated glucose transporter member 1-like isoform X2 n=1 Tax=Aricia agestis TaxID=91739 RepID=UPI001C207BE9|nr:solute carrier family 2, facilitated glucose transporter member 1-like isoform X2 [Aricia agestis]
MVSKNNEKITTNEHEHLTVGSPPSGWSFYLVLAAIVTTLGSSLPVGYNIGVINTPAANIQRFCNSSFLSRYGVQLDEASMNILWSSVVAIFIVGGCTGSILGSVLADKLGRKKATILTNLLSIAGAALFCTCRAANSVEMLVLGRLLVGLSGGLTTSIVPMYLTELSPAGLTGTMGAACPVGVNVGVLVGQVMGLDFLLGGVNDWPYLLSAFVVLVIICLPILFILPESPKYLYVVKKRENEALNELHRLRGVSPSALVEDVESLKEEGRAGSGGWGMCRALRSPRLRLPLMLVCALQAGQQTSGINAVFYYSQTIFENAGATARVAAYATVACGAVNVCTALGLARVLPTAGRRPLLLASTAAAAVLLTALAASIAAMNYVWWMSYVCMSAVVAYVFVYGLGLGPIPYFIASEIFEVAPRGAGMAWGSLANWGGNFLVGMCFPSLRAAIGPACFLIFAGTTAALFCFVKLYFPETRGKSPTQVTELCARGLASRPLLGLPVDQA